MIPENVIQTVIHHLNVPHSGGLILLATTNTGCFTQSWNVIISYVFLLYLAMYFNNNQALSSSWTSRLR